MTMHADDLEALVLAARRGDERAWADLYRRLDPLVQGVARRHRLAHADREDVSQRTWLRLFLHLDGLREPAALPAWLTVTARREALRATARRDLPVATLPEAGADEAVPAHEVAVERERCAALHAALGTLTPRHRQLMGALVARPELTYRELGGVVGMPTGSIGPIRARCLDRLRQDRELARVAAA